MSESPAATSLPNYARPPLVETVLGVQFGRLPHFANAHLGAFWKTLDASEWPQVVDAPLLPSQREQFQRSGGWGTGLRIQITDDPAVRMRVRSRSQDRMIQLQHDRLHLNWLRRGELNFPESYPKYAAMRQEFHNHLAGLRTFVAREALGEWRPEQWELTYVNEIPRGTVWRTPADWNFFAGLAPAPSIEGLIAGESFGGEWHFEIPPQKGRLHARWEHLWREQAPPEQREAIRFTLTARGGIEFPPGDDDDEETMRGLDLGHATIVRAFRALMSPAANAYWGMTSDGHA